MLENSEIASLVIEAAQDYAFIVVDSARCIVGWNLGAERLLGWKESEVLGQDAALLFTPEDQAAGVVEREFEGAAFTGRADDHRWHMRQSGTRFYASGWLYRIEKEGFHGFVKVIRDLTEIQLAEEKLKRRDERFHTLAENLQEFIYITGSDGKLAYLNSRWTEYTGLSLEETRADGGASVIHPDDAAAVAEAWVKAFATGTEMEIQLRCRNKAGEYRWFLTRAFPVRNPDGSLLHWVGSSTDIEDQKRHEQQVEALNVRLNRAMQETHHRVKNNLQVILSLVEIQAAHDLSSMSETAKQRLKQHIQALATIHDLLTQQAKTDAEATQVSVASVLANVLPLLQQTNPSRSLRSEVENLTLSVSKASSLSLLISELVSNAVKHGEGTVFISLKSQGNAATLEVSDEGRGFPKGFDPASAANTGLGLIENTARWDLRGEISYQNRPEGGGLVRVRFPDAG